ncbi:MAG: LiaF-related protein [Bryobacteraceae bacterium]|nr:LiaF-related protein [Bryobacteraceae bacterium]
MTTQMTHQSARPVPWGAFVLLILVFAWLDAGRPVLSAGHSLALFGRTEYAADSAPLDRAAATAVFGRAELDLRRAQLPEKGATVRANAVFGSIDVRVPEGWRVEVDGIGILGKYRGDDRNKVWDGPVLRVEGVALFGQVRVRN